MVDVLIQTHNEEINLPHALKSLEGWTRRVFVVDSGSTDSTAEIARQWGATFVQHPWEGYAGQKNWALDHLPFESPWILILDADESVTPGLRDEILALAKKPPEDVRESAFYINRLFIFMGQKIYHCGYFPSWNLRLFKRGRARYEHRRVHEHMTVDGPTGSLKRMLLHEDRRGLEHFIAKHNRYSTLEAREIYDSQVRWPGLSKFLSDRVQRRRFLKDRVVPRIPLPWAWRLIYMYIFRLGFLDGRAGWILCSLISGYQFFIHSKYQDLRRVRMQPLRVQAHPPRLDSVVGLAQPEGSLEATDQLGAVPVATYSEHTRLQTAVGADARGGNPPGEAPSGQQAEVQTETHEEPQAEIEAIVIKPIAAPQNSSGVKKTPVSVVIATLNEAKNLRRCLDHLQWADEVVIMDSGSTDETCRIASVYGAKLIQFKANGRALKKKNWAFRHAPLKHQWVLMLDADEWITPDLAEEIGRAIQSNEFAAYYINRRLIFMGKWIRHCGYYPSWNLCLLKRGSGEYDERADNINSGDNIAREHIAIRGQAAYLHHEMLHFAFPSIHSFIEKHNRYTSWEAATHLTNGDNVEPTFEARGTGSRLAIGHYLKNLSRRLPFRPMRKFLYSFIFKRGFLDGRAGFTFCRLLAIQEYLLAAKLHETRAAKVEAANGNALSDIANIDWCWQPMQMDAAGLRAETAISNGASGNGAFAESASEPTPEHLHLRRRQRTCTELAPTIMARSPSPNSSASHSDASSSATYRELSDTLRARRISPWTRGDKIRRVLWASVQATLFRCSFHNWYPLRRYLLRLFGAKVGARVRLRRTVRIEIPWNLHIGDDVMIGDFVILYCLGPIKIGDRSMISQYSHLCAGSHDGTRNDYPLLRPPITIGQDCWIAADAFVGPGVTIGDRTILGARASAFSDLPSGVIAVGNPAKAIKPRVLRSQKEEARTSV